MRKQLVLIISCVCLALSAVAQNEGGNVLTQRSTTPQKSGKAGRSITIKTKSYNYEFSIGPRVGGGLSMMSEGDGLNIADGSGFGFDAGLGLNVRFGGKDSRGRALNGQGLFGIGLELNYASNSIKTKMGDNLNLGYFEVPLLFQFYPAFGSKQLKNLYIEVGPTFSMLLSSSPDQLVSESPFVTSIYNTGDFKGGDIKGTIGVGYRFSRSSANDGLYLNFRYNLGTSDLAGNFPAKISSAELTIGYLFKCIGGKKK